ncbi:MAG: cohesin domain-containing protein [Desulfuromonadales bacterium]
MRYLIPHTAALLALFVLTVISGCTGATKSFDTGETFEMQGKFEDAMYNYADAFQKDPSVNDYRVRFLKVREKAANQRFKLGMALVEKNNYIEALPELQAAQAIDPTRGIFKQQIDIITRLKDAQVAYQEGRDFEKSNKLKDAHRLYIKAVELAPRMREYEAALTRVAGLRKSRTDGFELNLKSAKPITLKFKDAKMKDVFKILTQLSGVNFIFDDGVKDAPVSIYLENASFQQALDLLVSMNKLNSKVLNEASVLVYADTPDKSKQYDDVVLRTFHLNYMDAKKAINLIRTMIQVRKAYVNEDSNSIIVRDTKDIVDVVEKILDANDLPDAEVILDVEVIEMSDKNAQNVGLLLSNYNVQLGMFSPSPDNKLLSSSLSGTTTTTTSGTTVTTGGGDITNLVKAFTLKGYGGFLTVPNATYNLGKTLAKGEVLSNPKIRVKNKEKSKFNVGTRVPITTTTLNGTLSQVNVQYVDVGVKVNAEPTIQLNNEISIKLNLEVSSILTKESVGGKDSPTTVVTIGTRNVETVLSLKDGETSIIGGLIQNSSSNDKTKIFLLGDIPIIGPLLSNSNTSKDKTELLLAITPRLVRGVSVPLPGLASFSTGREDHPSLGRPMASFEQEVVFDSSQGKDSKAPAAPVDSKLQQNVPVTTAPDVIAPAGAPPAVIAPAVVIPTLSPAVTSPEKPIVVVPAKAPALTPPPVERPLLQIAAPSSVAVGQQFSVDIKVNNVTDLLSAPFVLSFDPIFVEFISITEGQFIKNDGKAVSFNATPDPVSGTVSVALSRAATNGGVSGQGVIATVQFRAKNQGPASFAFKNAPFSSVKGTAIAVLPFSTAVDIR